DKPTLVLAHTTKGKGVSYMENAASWHHGVMTEEQYKQAVEEIEKVLA
ncbi:MAG: transketolase, partial [Solobacterium sp.]|nr:transketolase [Solobacterium sp.]